MQEQEKIKGILTLFAVGLMQQFAAIYREQPSAVTYLNPTLRTGWEKLSFVCHSQGVVPPLTLASLVAWLHQPLAEWGVGVPDEWADKRLLVDAVTTEFCEELGASLSEVGDLRLEMQDAVFRELHEVCRGLGDADLYSAMREFLISHPILDDVVADIQLNRLWPPVIRHLLRRCFEPIPVACIRRHHGRDWVAVCPHCGWTLAWVGDTPFCHRGGVCKAVCGEGFEGLVWREYDPALSRTTEGIQRYVVAPEVTLLSLRDELVKTHGVRCELFPSFDAYDMRIVLPSGKKWAVDMKDHNDSARLGRTMKPFLTVPAWDKAFVVFPQHRKDGDYLNRFKNHWKRAKNEDVRFAQELLRDVRKVVG
ncbi:MAG: hypothetical protein MUC99_06460 [Anaerolineae bacterium]|nr:hypothetical protein [Anaerolineae bacterium]